MSINFLSSILLCSCFLLFSCNNSQKQSEITSTEAKFEIERPIQKLEKDDAKLMANAADSSALQEKPVSNADEITTSSDKKERVVSNKPSPSKEIVKKSFVKQTEKKRVKAPVKQEKKGKLSFYAKTFDFGFIEIGEKISHDFHFKNTGKADINISDATATCGCTTPVYPFIPIEPGETGKISVYFNSEGRLGNQTATVSISSDAEEALTELTITGVVRTELAKSAIDSTQN